jgi:ADP-ribose pyrophosphatase
VREDEVIRPDGAPGIYGFVQTRIATGVLAVTPEWEVYLVGQYRYPTNEYSWEIVEGGTDDNETPLAAAKRELKEEAGLIADDWRQLGPEIHISNCISSEVGYLFLAQNLQQTESKPDGTEVLQIRRVGLDACLEMIENGEIKDGISLIALLYLDRFRKKSA